MNDDENAGGEIYEIPPEKPMAGLKTPETLSEARELLATLTAQFLAGAIKETTLRAATYSINGLTKVLQAEKTAELERRVHALEKLRAAK